MPAIELYPYQQKWIADQSRFKIGLWSRQIGKTFTSTLEIVDDCLKAESEGRRQRWVILSRGERQAKEAMDTGVKLHLKAFQCVFEAFEYDWEGSIKALEVTLPGGSRITALPANPDTARGFSASVLADEFSFHKDSRAIWRSLFPVISAGHKIRVISTPNGKSGKFYDLITADDPSWSKHIVNIYEAVKQGLPRDIEELKRGLNDEDGWRSEYLCEFVDEASAWLTYDLIASCEHDQAGDPNFYQFKPTYVGWDVARRRDLSVIWVIEQIGDVLWTREVVAMRRQTFAAQEAELDRVMKAYRVNRVCIDQTGLGEVLVENAKRKYGDYRVEGVLFNAPVKQDLAVMLKQRFEDRQLRIPISQDIRNDHHAVKKLVTVAGNARFDADATENGHADRFWANALAVHAATNPIVIDYESTGQRLAAMGAYNDDASSLFEEAGTHQTIDWRGWLR